MNGCPVKHSFVTLIQWLSNCVQWNSRMVTALEDRGKEEEKQETSRECAGPCSLIRAIFI